MSFTCCRCNSWFNELRFSWFYFLRLSSTAGCSCSLSNGPQSSSRFNLWDANASSQLSRGWCNTSIEHKRAAVLLVTCFSFTVFGMFCFQPTEWLVQHLWQTTGGWRKDWTGRMSYNKNPKIFPPLVFWWDFEEVAHCEELKVLFLQHTLKRLNRLCKIGNIWIKMVFIKIVKTALKRKCDWDIIGVTWSRSSGLSFRLCVIDQLWWWRHLLWLFFIHCWFEILNICALFDPHRGAHVIIVINSITRSCIQSALVDTWTKDDRNQESWSHIIIF